MSENLAGFVTDSAERFGDRPALKLDDTEVTYDMLNEGSARIAGLLKSKGFERLKAIVKGADGAIDRMIREGKIKRMVLPY